MHRPVGALTVCLAFLGTASLIPSERGPDVSSAQTTDGAGYRLIAQWPVPQTAITWPNRPVELAIWSQTNEVFALDAEPPRVLVLAPDGGRMRSFGEGILEAPGGIAVGWEPINPVLTVPDLPTNVRVYVTEPEAGRVVIFEHDGGFVGSVGGLGEPRAIVGTTRGLFVADAMGGRVVQLGFDGVELAELGPTGLVEPIALDVLSTADGQERTTLVVLDRVTRKLALFDIAASPPSLVANLAVDWGEGLWDPTDLASINAAHPSIDVVSDGELVHVDLDLKDPADVTVVSVARPLAPLSREQRVVALASLHGSSRTLPRGGLRWWAPYYAFVTGDSRFRTWYWDWDVAPGRYRRLCPTVDADEVRPWRVAVTPVGVPVVANTNGTLLWFTEQGVVANSVEVGDLDDLAMDANGQLHLTWRGRHTILGVEGDQVVVDIPAGYGIPLNVAEPWHNEWDCTPAGYGLPSSLAISADGQRIDWVSLGWLGQTSRHWSALASHYRVQLGEIEHNGSRTRMFRALGRWWGSAPSLQQDKAMLMTDIVHIPASDQLYVIDRLGAQVWRIDPTTDDIAGMKWLPQPWPVPGHPLRGALAPDGGLFVLTQEGVVWQYDADGKRVTGWDAGGAPNGPRAELTDIAADPQGRVYAVDRRNRQVLVFEPMGPASDESQPVLPPPCSVTVDKNADTDVVSIGQPLTVTLQITGDCGRAAADNDIVLLVSPSVTENRYSWDQQMLNALVATLLGEIDFDRDRVAVMRYSYKGGRGYPLPETLVLELTHDKEAVQSTIEDLKRSTAAMADQPSPLKLAQQHLSAAGRPDANRIIVAVKAGYSYPEVEWLPIDAEDLRRDGVRVFSITSSPFAAFTAAAIATQPEDFFVAPDAATLREVYRQIGRQLSARVLARLLTVTDVVPDNMAYVEDSASPAADWDATTRTLTWRASDVSFAGWTASYRLIPESLGEWPTNVRAGADVIDGFGNPFPVVFPVPWVHVIEPPTATPTPTITPTASATNTPSATATKTVERSQVFLPLVLREEPCIRPRHVALALVVDTSESMLEITTGNRTKLAAAIDGAGVLLNMLSFPSDQASVIGFNSAVQRGSLTSDREEAFRQLAALSPGSGSEIQLGVVAAHSELNSARRKAENLPAMVVLTDGRSSASPEEVIAAAQGAKTDGIAVFTIGLGDHVDRDTLVAMATRRDFFYEAADAEDLAQIYRAVATSVSCPGTEYWGQRRTGLVNGPTILAMNGNSYRLRDSRAWIPLLTFAL